MLDYGEHNHDLTMPIASAIFQLFEAYRKNPFAVMREIGLQTRLHTLLQFQLMHETCRVSVRAGAVTKATGFVTERVQMEVRVTNQDGVGPKKSDIVVLRSTRDKSSPGIVATRYPNGPFDIVSKISLPDASGVIEVKAACSADLSERHKFRLDLFKLLQLAGECLPGAACPELHFVLIDKSVGVGGEGYGGLPLGKRMPKKDWHIEETEFLNTQTDRSRELFWNSSPRFQLLDEEPTDRPFVHVWQLSHLDGVAGPEQPLHRWAVS